MTAVAFDTQRDQMLGHDGAIAQKSGLVRQPALQVPDVWLGEAATISFDPACRGDPLSSLP
jgi:hypothetical protein